MKNPKEKSQVEDSAWRLKQQLPLLPNDFHSLIGQYETLLRFNGEIRLWYVDLHFLLWWSVAICDDGGA